MTNEEIDKLLEIESKATPGPWGYCYDGSSTYSVGPERDPQGGQVCSIYHRKAENPPNAEIIKAMRNNIRSILLELKAARKIVFFSAALVKSVAPELMDEYQNACDLENALEELEGE